MIPMLIGSLPRCLVLKYIFASEKNFLFVVRTSKLDGIPVLLIYHFLQMQTCDFLRDIGCQCFKIFKMTCEIILQAI